MRVTEKPTWKQEIEPFWQQEAPGVELQVQLQGHAAIVETAAVVAQKRDFRLRYPLQPLLN
jgi:hypothetical protein